MQPIARPTHNGRHAVAFAFVFAVVNALAARAESPMIFPEELRGAWLPACPAPPVARLELASRAARVQAAASPTACKLAGLRRQQENRWYVDLTCADQTLLQLDILMLEPDRALIATRPLGQACSYHRAMAR